MPSVSVQDAVPSPAAEGERLERTVFEVKRVIVGQDRLVERMLVGLLARGHLLIEGVPGVAKTLAVETFARVVGGTFSRIQFTPDLVPSDLLGTRIYRAGPRGVRHRARPGGRQLRARRRDQPRAREGAVRAARGDGRAARLDRRQDLPDARPVPGAGHPEPDRERGRLPAAGGAARPVPVQAARRTTRSPRRSARSSTGWASSPPVAAAGAADPPSWPGCSRSRPTCSCTTRWSTTSCGWSFATRTPGRARARPTSRAGSPTARRRAPRSASSPPPARSRWSAAATTWSRRTCSTSPPDVLRHRLVLSYDALADGVPVEHDPHPAAADHPVAAGHRPSTRCRRSPAAARRRERADRTPRPPSADRRPGRLEAALRRWS